jgi:class 3 adenylate cyclase
MLPTKVRPRWVVPPRVSWWLARPPKVVTEQVVIGELPNLAARLQGLAEPNAVVIADGTRQLLGGLFDLQDLGPQFLKEWPTTSRAGRWRTRGRKPLRGRADAA